MKKLLVIIVMMITTQVYSRTYFEHPNQLIVATKKNAKSLIEQVFDKDLSELIQAKKLALRDFIFFREVLLSNLKNS